MAKCVWALEREEITTHVCDIQEADARGWLLTVMNSMKQDDLTRVLVTIWAIWYARRKAIYEESYQSPMSTNYFVNRFIQDLESVAEQSAVRAVKVTSKPPRWLPPPPGLMKINVDATVSKNSKNAVYAAVARSSTGQFLGASSVVAMGMSDP
jgi:hypothetical protein